MSEPNPGTRAAPVEILAEWEAPAIHEPGVLYEETLAEHPELEGDVPAFAAWIAATAIGGAHDHPTHQAIKRKVIGALKAWQQRFGQDKIDAVKQELWLQMQRCRNNRKMTEEELRKQIDLLFGGV